MKFSRYILSCAIIAAGIIIFIKLLVFFLNAQFQGIGIYSGLISLATIIIPLSFAIKNKRDAELGGSISLRQVMSVGLFISAMAGVLVAVFNFVYFKFIDTEILSHYLEEAKRFGLREKRSETQISEMLVGLKNFYSPANQATGSLTGVLGVGIVSSFILATFFIRKKPISGS